MHLSISGTAAGAADLLRERLPGCIYFLRPPEDGAVARCRTP